MPDKKINTVSKFALILGILLFYISPTYSDFTDFENLFISPFSIKFLIITLIPLVTNIDICRKFLRITNKTVFNTLFGIFLLLGYFLGRYFAYLVYGVFIQTLLIETSHNVLLSQSIIFSFIFLYWFLVSKFKKSGDAVFYLLELEFVFAFSFILRII